MWSRLGNACACVFSVAAWPPRCAAAVGLRRAAHLLPPAGKTPSVKAPATGTGEKATGRGRPASEFPPAMQQPLLDFLATAKDRSIDKVRGRAV